MRTQPRSIPVSAHSQGDPQNTTADYPWAKQQPTAWQIEQSEPLEYHQLLRGMRRYAWWKPLLITLTATGYYFIFSVIAIFAFIALVLPLIATSGNYSPSDLKQLQDELTVLDTQQPLRLAFQLISIILMIPAVVLALLTFRVRPPLGRLLSVVGRIRWKLFAYCAGFAAAAFLVSHLLAIPISMLLDSQDIMGSSSGPITIDPTRMVASLIVIVMLVPLQAAAEEIVFRGALLQVLGAWIRNPIVPIAITTLLFMAGHIYDIWGSLIVGVLGAAAAYLSIRTGGLEAAIALHTINNLVVFTIMATGYGGSTKQEAAGGNITGLIIEIVLITMYVLAVEMLWRKQSTRRGWVRQRIDWVEKQKHLTATAQHTATPAQAAELTAPLAQHSATPAVQPSPLMQPTQETQQPATLAAPAAPTLPSATYETAADNPPADPPSAMPAPAPAVPPQTEHSALKTAAVTSHAKNSETHLLGLSRRELREQRAAELAAAANGENSSPRRARLRRGAVD